jgi:riboflavin kinase/FMN adenylyltransferase
MKIIERIEDIEKPLKNAVIAIGNFDGVHIGHQALFHTAIEKAESMSGTSVAMTFEPHPMRVITTNDHPPLITLYEQKTELIARTGIQVMISVPFTREFAAIPAEQFINNLLVERIGMKAIIVGKDYSFGRGREGNIDMLHQMASKLGYEVIVLDWIQPARGNMPRISSTHIRKLVMAGKMEQAAKILGRPYQIRGRVATGRNRGGRLLGFPTANINLQDELCPLKGIYAVTVEHDGKTMPGVANIGYSPTFNDHVFTVEVHILDFNQNVYDDPIRVNFIKRLRDEIKFKGTEDLSEQIRKDIQQTRQILAGLSYL